MAARGGAAAVAVGAGSLLSMFSGTAVAYGSEHVPAVSSPAVGAAGSGAVADGPDETGSDGGADQSDPGGTGGGGGPSDGSRDYLTPINKRWSCYGI